MNVATQIQSVCRSDGGSAPRDNLDSPECQWRPCQLDELQRQIPSKDFFGHRDKSTFTFTFMHLADTFIQSDLHCIQVTVFLHFYQLLLSLGIEPMILALLVPCSTIWATGKLSTSLQEPDKTTRTRQVLCSIWPVLQPRIKPRHAGFIWPEENCPPTETGCFQGSTQFLSPMEFWVLVAVAFGLLIWGRLADCKDIIGRELNWMMSTLNHQWTDFNWKNYLLLSSCIVDKLFSCLTL